MTEVDLTRYAHLTDLQRQFMGIVAAHQGKCRLDMSEEFFGGRVEFTLDTAGSDNGGSVSEDQATAKIELLGGYATGRIDLIPYNPGVNDRLPWMLDSKHKLGKAEFVGDSQAQGLVMTLQRAHDHGMFVPV